MYDYLVEQLRIITEYDKTSEEKQEEEIGKITTNQVF
jgi:hypothetical protein